MKKTFVLAAALTLAALMGCAPIKGEATQLNEAVPEEGTKTVIPAAEDLLPQKTAVLPTPTQTPVPTPTLIPFSVYTPTVNMSFEELIGDDGERSLPEGYPKAGTYRIIVDIAHQVTMVYKADENGEYKPERYMLCSTGAHDCTPKGTFKMGAYRVRFSKFARDGRYGQYWTQIRKAIYFHTTLYTAKDVNAYEEASFNKLGEADSHGCIRLTVPDARWMWYHIAPGTECVIRDGDPNDADTAAIRAQLIIAKAPEERVELEAGEQPYTDDWLIEDIVIEEKFHQGSQEQS